MNPETLPPALAPDPPSQRRRFLSQLVGVGAQALADRLVTPGRAATVWSARHAS